VAAENHRPNLEGSLTPDGQLQQLAAQAAALSPADRDRLADYLLGLSLADTPELNLPEYDSTALFADCAPDLKLFTGD